MACGSGLVRIYQFLRSDEKSNRPEFDLDQDLDAPAITKAAQEGDPLALEAVDLFLAIVGAEAGYMGVRALATGGIYICGGITPRVPPLGFRVQFPSPLPLGAFASVAASHPGYLLSIKFISKIVCTFL